MGFSEVMVTREFAASEAGKRVGWVQVGEAPEDYSVIPVNVVLATVGSEGAKHGHHEYEQDGEVKRAYSDECDEGFLAVCGLSVLVSKERGIETNGGSITYQGEEKSGAGASILQRGVIGIRSLYPPDEKRQWGVGSDEILPILKEGLKANDIDNHYPEIYYLLNGMMGHEHFRKRTTTLHTNPQELFVPDKDMQTTTRAQAVTASKIASKLETVWDEDKKMRNRLTVFSDIPASEITETFKNSRRAVAKMETEIIEHRKDLLVDDLVYLPIGFRPNGRSWPYMDATIEDEERAFGNELEALKQKNSFYPEGELIRELKEIEYRMEYAQQGGYMLHLLALAELSSAQVN
jgi:hypothetical protein